MFQPQPTPFASYGQWVGSEFSDYTFPAAPLDAGHGGVGAGSPALFYASPPVFSPGPGSAFAAAPPQPRQPQPRPAAQSAYDRAAAVAAIQTTTSTTTTPTPPLKAEDIKMEPQNTTDDLAAQEAAARDYQPQLQGPCVGVKESSNAIADEYAKADEVYIAKTIALPQTYSHYRPIRGDGNCGWRAIGFSYFETLIQAGDDVQVEGELARLMSLNQYLQRTGGYDMSLFEDMLDGTFTLFRDILARLPNQVEAMDILMETFNDETASSSIIYHLRLLAASWLKGNAEVYEPFTAETGVAGYCQNVIELVNQEIEHLGIVLLVDVLLKPIEFVLEIAYLDRSPGSEVNVYRLPESANGEDPSNLGPIIHLLYRPEHYDILYLPPPVTSSPVSLQVNRAGNFTQQHEITSTPGMHSFSSTVDLSALAMLPGFGAAPGMSPLGTTTTASAIGDYGSSPSWVTQPQHYMEPISPHQQHAPVPASPQASLPSPNEHHVRFSKYMVEDKYGEPTFMTNTFKNSHFNTAHYSNPNFQPEEYKPWQEEGSEKSNGRKRSTG